MTASLPWTKDAVMLNMRNKTTVRVSRFIAYGAMIDCFNLQSYSFSLILCIKICKTDIVPCGDRTCSGDLHWRSSVLSMDTHLKHLKIYFCSGEI